jgi:hypothetical protein
MMRSAAAIVVWLCARSSTAPLIGAVEESPRCPREQPVDRGCPFATLVSHSLQNLLPRPGRSSSPASPWPRGWAVTLEGILNLQMLEKALSARMRASSGPWAKANVERNLLVLGVVTTPCFPSVIFG